MFDPYITIDNMQWFRIIRSSTVYGNCMEIDKYDLFLFADGTL